MVYITGDVHGILDVGKLFEFAESPIGKSLTKNDYLIVTGDFGIIWSLVPDFREKELLNFYDEATWTTLFVDGNHENFDRLFSDEFEEIEMFGDKVKKISESVYHLQRGHVYEIENKKFFTMGGAFSIDKQNRQPGWSWWPEELPSHEEYELGFVNLEKHNNKVDYIIGHTTITEVINEYLDYHNFTKQWLEGKFDKVTLYFNEIVKKVEFDKFYFGHFHDDWISSNNKYIMTYDSINRII